MPREPPSLRNKMVHPCFPGTTHDYDLRPSRILKMPTTHTCVAERCIRFILPKIINDTDPSVTDKVYTHSFQGFTNYVKVTKINSYATRCLIANCYICQHSWRTNKSNAYAQNYAILNESVWFYGNDTEMLLLSVFEIVCFMLYIEFIRYIYVH